MKPLWEYPAMPLSLFTALYDDVMRLLRQIASALKDWRNWIIFAVVYAVMTSPTWAGWILYFITDNPWHLTYSTAYMAFWALPFTPLLGLCFAITFAIRRLITKKSRFENIQNG